MKVIRIIFYYLIFFIACIVALVPCFFLSLLPVHIRYDNKLYYFFMDLFYRLTLWGALLPIKIIGKGNIPQDPAIFVANHQSALDVVLIGKLLQRYPHLWFFKVELLKIPLYGIMLKRMNIVVDRINSRKAFMSIKEAIRLTQNKNRSLIIFPEGGRYADGKIHDFLLGFAIIARKTGRPVIPVLLIDVYKVFPSGSIVINYHPITIVIGKSFILNAEETDEEFVHRVKTWFIEQSKE